VATNLVEIYDATTGKQEKSLNVQEKEQAITSLAFSPDGALAAVGGGDGKVRLFDIAKEKQEGAEIVATRRPWSICA